MLRSVYANSLFTDSQKAIDDSDSYQVSPDLQGANDEFRIVMVGANWAVFYISAGIEEYNKGNMQVATSDFNQATLIMKSNQQDVNNVTNY